MNALSKQFSKGFTLVEVLVSMAIFVTAMSLGVLSVVTMSNASKRIQVKDQAVQSAYFVMDSISRSIRMGSDYKCNTNTGVDMGYGACENVLASGFQYLNQEGKVVQLAFNTVPNQAYSVLQRRESTTNVPASGLYTNLHSDYALKIKSGGFLVHNEDPNDGAKQPFVSIRMLASYTYRGVEYTIPLQTLLTQRKLDKTQ